MGPNRLCPGSGKGRSLGTVRNRHGDWSRDGALWLGRRQGRLSQAQLGSLAGGMDYAAVGQAVSRFAKRLEREPALQREIAKITCHMLRCDSNERHSNERPFPLHRIV